MPRPIRVLLADDHAPVRAALASFFEAVEDVSVIGEAEDGERVVELAPHLQPDVILMDYRMPGMNGIEATRQIRAMYPYMRVIGLSLYGPDVSEQMREAGAVDCVTKGADLAALVDAVRLAVGTPVSRPR